MQTGLDNVTRIAGERWAPLVRWSRRGLAAGALLVAGCESDWLTVPNYANPTPEALSQDVAGDVQYRANGVLDLGRRNITSWVSDAGIFGRESFNYFLSDSRLTTNYLDAPSI